MSFNGHSKKDKAKRKRYLKQSKPRARAPETKTDVITPREQRGCFDKVTYETLAEANLVASSWNHLSPYPCQFCGKWHLTSH